MSLNGVETNRMSTTEEFLTVANKADVLRCRLLRVNPFRLLPAMKGRLSELLSRVDILQATCALNAILTSFNNLHLNPWTTYL